MTAARQIRFEDVWKSYPRWGAGQGSLRGALRSRLPGQAIPRERRWALRDVSCTFESGVATGLIGANGAGKSTMLRLASGVGAATRGRILLPQNTASVLNLGYVFDGQLSGRENAVTAALMAGLSAAGARAALPRVLAFAELDAFADAPLRTYSDGMRLRLAFGVVAQLKPDALLLDEVMAVGDLRFQAKCVDRISEMQADGATVVFASHGLEQIAEQCDRAVWLQGGGVRMHADAAEVVAAYEAAMHDETLERTPAAGADAADGVLELGRNRLGSQEVVIDEVRIVAAGGGGPRIGQTAEVHLQIDARTPVVDPHVVVTLHRVRDGVICIEAGTASASHGLGALSGPASVVLRLDRLALLPGEYTAEVGVYENKWLYAYDVHLGAAHPFTVSGSVRNQGVYDPAPLWQVTT